MPAACRIAVAPQQGTVGKAASAASVKLAQQPQKRVAAGINSKVEQFLREQRSRGKLLRQERTALVAYDLTNNTYLANINSQRSFQAASMIKPFVALAFFQQVEEGKMQYGPNSRQMMERMIQHSSNQAIV